MKTRSIAGGLAVLLIVTLLSPACSVKENRTACPCYTSVDVDDFILAGFAEATVSFSADHLLRREMISLQEYEDIGYMIALDRRSNRAAVIAGLDNSVVRGDSLMTPYGLEADPIWLYSEKFYCDGDEHWINARPHKQYCRLEIVVTGLSPGDIYDCCFRVKAESCGLDLYGRQALEGEYCALAERSSTGDFTVRIPRQLENRLSLELLHIGNPDEPLFTIELDRKLEAAGYDWTREDLRDISVEVDYAGTEVNLKILDWDSDDVFKQITI
jgi:hypothetical protein